VQRLIGEGRICIVGLVVLVDRAGARREGRVRAEQPLQDVGVIAEAAEVADQEIQIFVELLAVLQAVVRMQILVREESANQIIEPVVSAGKAQFLAEIVEAVAVGIGALPDKDIGVREVGVLAVNGLPFAIGGNGCDRRINVDSL
jgi:hypothetical protein